MIKKYLLLMVICLPILTYWLFTQINSVTDKALSITSNVSFEVMPGTGLNALCRQWQNKAYVDKCWQLQLFAKLNPQITDLKAGLYQLKPGSLYDNIVRINQGKVQLFSFTIIEGETLKQVTEKLAKSKHLKKVIPENQSDFLVSALNISQSSAEGWLFPETYFYQAEDTDLSILKRAKSRMSEVLQSLWITRDLALPYDNDYQALIMASIIEKETGKGEERPMIASVFVNRLNKNMRLQTDPTVIYGLGDSFAGDITRQHLRSYTPFNTYKIKGLPPTPIAMPSKAAIEAALTPAQSSYYYFVAKGDGSHQFSETLLQHNLAVKKYQLKGGNGS